MPTKTIQALNFATPNPDFGGNPVTGAAVGGHAATTASVSGIAVETKTCKWVPYPGVGLQITGVRVKFDWARNGALGAGTSNVWAVQAGFGAGVGEIETVFTESNVTGASSGSVNYALTGARITDPFHLFVNDSIGVVGAIGQNASLTITISNLVLEVTYAEPQPVWIG